MSKLNESNIIVKTIDESGYDEHTVKNVLSTFWSIISKELRSGNSVNLLGKGKIFLRLRKGGVVHIPQGQSNKLDDYPVLRFQASKTLSRQLKKDYDEGLITIKEED